MIGTLRNAGYAVVHDPSVAKAIVVNTCGFIREAVQESIDLILELSEHKTDGECQALIVVGCMAQRYRSEIEESIPEADVIVGVGEYEGIADVVAGLIGPGDGKKQEAGLSRLAARSDDVASHIAYVKIAEGCDNCCTYCTIPKIRGPYKSRPMESIVDECTQLAAAGAKELVLVAQDTALYGTDIYGTQELPALLCKIAEACGDAWIRLMYAYPEHITDELIETMAVLPQVCKYIDMPIQHSENAIIGAMGRKGSRTALKDLIQRIRLRIPNIVIRTTLIVGFPGENNVIFLRLLKFVRTMQFDRLGVFPYSQEEGTPAALLPEQLGEETKQKRVDEIMRAQQRIHFEKQANLVSRILPVMVDSRNEDGKYIGRTQWDAYEVDSVVTFTSDEELTQGEVCRVRILGSQQYDLRGRHEPTE